MAAGCLRYPQRTDMKRLLRHLRLVPIYGSGWRNCRTRTVPVQMSIVFGSFATASHFRAAPYVLHSRVIRRCPMLSIPREQHSPVIAAALPRTETEAFLVARDHAIATLAAADLRAAVRDGRALLARLPLRSQRTPVQKAAGEAIVHLTADAAWRFFRRHAVPMYRELTRDGTRSIRVDALLWEAAARWPDILPAQAELIAESDRMQADKDGLEIHQGLFVSQVMANPQTGHHLIRSMLRPRAESLEAAAAVRCHRLRRSGYRARRGAGQRGPCDHPERTIPQL